MARTDMLDAVPEDSADKAQEHIGPPHPTSTSKRLDMETDAWFAEQGRTICPDFTNLELHAPHQCHLTSQPIQLCPAAQGTCMGQLQPTCA